MQKEHDKMNETRAGQKTRLMIRDQREHQGERRTQ